MLCPNSMSVLVSEKMDKMHILTGKKGCAFFYLLIKKGTMSEPGFSKR